MVLSPGRRIFVLIVLLSVTIFMLCIARSSSIELEDFVPVPMQRSEFRPIPNDQKPTIVEIPSEHLSNITKTTTTPASVALKQVSSRPRPRPAAVMRRPPEPVFKESSIVIDDRRNTHPPAWRLRGRAKRMRRCKKTMLLTLGGSSGWGSNMGFIVRAAVYAEHLHATLLIDNANWDYGRLEYYFEPMKINCVPPKDWYRKDLGITIGEPGWKKAERIVINGQHAQEIENFEYELHLASQRNRLQDLWRAERLVKGRREGILPANETLPKPLIPHFRKHSRALQRLWNPVLPILEDLQKVKKSLGVHTGQPTIAVHVRLGDKKSEYNKILRWSNMKNSFGNLTTHLEGMQDCWTRLQEFSRYHPSSWIPLTFNSPTYPSSVQPKAIIISAESGLPNKMAKLENAAPFMFDQTPTLSMPRGSYSQGSFRKLTLRARVAHTRALIRDITLMAKETDAAVVSGASNIGRLVMLLAGDEACLGPVDRNSLHVGGRIRSLDIWWYGTLWPQTTWRAIGRDQPPPPAAPPLENS